MSSGRFSFDGLDPWRPHFSLTDCQVPPCTLNLKDSASFVSYTVGFDRTLSLSWRHHGSNGGPASPSLVVLDFEGVREFQAQDASDWNDRSEGVWSFWPSQDYAEAALTFEVGEHHLSFFADGVSFVFCLTSSG